MQTAARRGSRVLVLVSLACAMGIALACGGGGETSPSPADGGSSGSSGSNGADGQSSADCNNAVRAGLACSGQSPCCAVTVPDGFGAEGYRCRAGFWEADNTCLPPPPACDAPVQGALARANGSSVKVTCVRPGGLNRVASIALTLEGTGEIVEVYFDRAPAAGDVLDVIEHTEGQRPDAGVLGDGGTSNRASLRIGRPGGFSGFDVSAKSASGKLTVTSIEASSATVISSLRASVDVTLTGGAPWAGTLTGSW